MNLCKLHSCIPLNTKRAVFRGLSNKLNRVHLVASTISMSALAECELFSSGVRMRESRVKPIAALARAERLAGKAWWRRVPMSSKPRSDNWGSY